MSSLRRRANGYYFLDLRIQGKRVRKALKTKDRKLASARAKLAMRDIRGPETSGSITLADFRAEFEEYSRTRYAASSVKAHRYVFNKLAANLPCTRLGDITPRIADEFITRISPKLKPAAINFHIRTIKSIFAIAVKWEYLDENPFRKVQQLRYEKPMPRILSFKEISSLLFEARKASPDLAALFEFYLLTGTRRSEALALEWTDIDFTKDIAILRNTKGKRPRIVYLSPRVKAILQARRKGLKPFPFLGNYVTHQFKKIAEEAEITGVTLHDLRKSFVSYAADVGMSPLLIPWLVGHVDSSVTSAHYAGFNDEMIRKYYLLLESRIFQN